MPWRLSDLVSLITSLAIGLTALVAGWVGISGEPRHSEQTAWLNLGIAGLIITGVGITVWLLAGRRAIGQRRAALLPDPIVEEPAAPIPIRDVARELVAVAGASRYHLAGCELVSGKTVRSVPAARRRALQPCGVCAPEAEAAAEGA